MTDSPIHAFLLVMTSYQYPIETSASDSIRTRKNFNFQVIYLRIWNFNNYLTKIYYTPTNNHHIFVLAKRGWRDLAKYLFRNLTKNNKEYSSKYNPSFPISQKQYYMPEVTYLALLQLLSTVRRNLFNYLRSPWSIDVNNL